MKKLEVYLVQNKRTLELELEVKIPADMNWEEFDSNWELIERSRLIIKQIKNYGFKVAETQE